MGLKRFGRAWNKVGARNPYGAILTGRAGELRDWSDEEFFATGRADAARFIADLARIAPTVARRRLLDFGCGVGRVTRPLAEHFESVVGVDAAPTMIAHAQRLNQSYANCEFVVNRGTDLRGFATGTFDVIYSRLVLQHVPPPFVTRYIPELIRVLAPGGVLMFQLPDDVASEAEAAFLKAPVVGHAMKRHLPAPIVRAYRRIKYRFIVDESGTALTMFGMPRETVLKLVCEAGGRVITVEPDESHGAMVPGFQYWISK